jgi:CHAT domain-containing protein
LHDGQHFLIEKYRFSLIPNFTLADTSYTSLANNQLVAMGVSEFPLGQEPLPAVPIEILTITEKLWSGKSFLNQEATMNNLKAQRQQPFQIIHLATHAKFQPGSPRNSYIQLWDEKLLLDNLTDLKWSDLPRVELLVLSACETALGDKDAEMGFAGLAVKAGVKSAVASLWKSGDASTLRLMTNFYQQLRESPIKAEALRQAQIAMLHGQVPRENDQLRKAELKEEVPQPSEQEVNIRDESLSHPAYWAAFTVIGSPW